MITNIHSTKSTNMVEIIALGPDTSIPIEIEADTGASITVKKADVLQELSWVKLRTTNVYITGYSGTF